MGKKRCAVVLGAGASHDAWNGATECDPRFKPPLAAELFPCRAKDGGLDEHRFRQFYSVLRRYHGAHVLGQELGPLSLLGEVPIEARLREYVEHPDPLVKERFKHIPLYLRHLLADVSLGYIPKNRLAGCYVQLAKGLLADHGGHQVEFVSLNYDTFLEDALYAFAEYTFQELKDYVAPERRARIYKIHGSVDWYQPIADASTDWDFALERFDPLQKPKEVWKGSLKGEVPYKLRDHLTYPVLTAPLAGKGLLDLVCPEEHTQVLKTMLAKCTKFLVIGTSGQDEDLLAIMAESVARADLVDFVGLGRQSKIMGRFESASQPLNGAEKRTFEDGFRQYLVSSMFEEFLRA